MENVLIEDTTYFRDYGMTMKNYLLPKTTLLFLILALIFATFKSLMRWPMIQRGFIILSKSEME